MGVSRTLNAGLEVEKPVLSGWPIGNKKDHKENPGLGLGIKSGEIIQIVQFQTGDRKSSLGKKRDRMRSEVSKTRPV